MSDGSARVNGLRLAIAAVFAFAFSAPVPASQPAQSQRADIQPGTVADHVQSAHDEEQTFAVYLPSTYTSDRAWPVLFLMDPRGRARVPLDLFRPAAERLGYVLVSSYNTSSDASEDVNTPALEAMLTDSTQMFTLDDRRFYLAGFSGTARSAWAFAEQLQSLVAGIIGFGGGLPGELAPPAEAPYGYYGAAGTTDFNYDEMRALDRRLDDGGIDHRFEYFVGGHSWGPEEVCSRALEWMELRAMKTRLRPPDGSLAVDLYTRRVIEAQVWEGRAMTGWPGGTSDDGSALEAEPPAARGVRSAIDAYEALVRYRALLTDFEGVIGSSALDRIAAKVAALEELDEVKATVELADRLSERHRTYVQILAAVDEQLRSGSLRPVGSELIRDLGLVELKLQAADVDNIMESLAAQRLIESVFVQVAFYQPRGHLGQGDPAGALELLEVADFLRPDSFSVLLFMARAHAQLGSVDAAVEALRRAHAITAIDASMLEGDVYLDPIRETPAFQRLIEQL